MVSAGQALARLKEGNRRFVNNAVEHCARNDEATRSELALGQNPFAIILGCSDSRVPAEIVFDQGIGDLFVIRVAGNIVTPSQIGSIEFAAEKFGSRLVVVLGHTQCGGVISTLDELQRPSQTQSPNLRAIVDGIRPAVEGLLETDVAGDEAALVDAAVRANVVASADKLRIDSEILASRIKANKLDIVGAEYSLETGEVDFFHSP